MPFKSKLWTVWERVFSRGIFQYLRLGESVSISCSIAWKLRFPSLRQAFSIVIEVFVMSLYSDYLRTFLQSPFPFTVDCLFTLFTVTSFIFIVLCVCGSCVCNIPLQHITLYSTAFDPFVIGFRFRWPLPSQLTLFVDLSARLFLSIARVLQRLSARLLLSRVFAYSEYVQLQINSTVFVRACVLHAHARMCSFFLPTLSIRMNWHLHTHTHT